MDTLLNDLKFALRTLRKQPGFAAVTVLTLALGIGANTAIFSIVNGVLLRPLAFPEPERLVHITSQFAGQGFDRFWISMPEFVELRERSQSFESVGAYVVGAANLGTERPSRPVAATISHDLFTVLGVPAMMGRLFTNEDTLPGAEAVSILSSELWQREFGAHPSIVGSLVEINGVKRRIVGIMPPGFDVHDQRIELYSPATIDPANPGGRGNHFLYLIGRLESHVTLDSARAELETLLAHWNELTPNTHVPNVTNHRFRYDPLKDDVIGGISTALWVLQGAVVFVLLIACANLGNLLLARAEARHREFAVRTALGASRSRMLAQFVTEGIVLSLLGALAGVGLAIAGLRTLVAVNAGSIPRISELSIDLPVLLFTLGVALFTGLVFGFAPLMHFSSGGLNDSLKEAGTRSTSSALRARARGMLVVAEVALAVVLVIGAGLLLRSFWNLLRVDAGFDRARMVTFGLVLPNPAYPEPTRRVAFFRDVIDRMKQVPGVLSAAVMSGLPPRRQVNANDTDFEDVMMTPGGIIENVDYWQFVSTGYVDTMGIPIMSGRDFREGDIGGPPVVLVNESLVRKFFPDRDPIGRRLKPGFNERFPWFTIVGIVKDVKQGGVESATGTEIYFVMDQYPNAMQNAPGNMNVVVRTSLPVESVASAARQMVGEMDRSLPLVKLRAMEDVFSESVAKPRFLTMLLGSFAGLALLLAAIGTYGILSYLIAERRQEIGIRMALGASRSDVFALVLRYGLTLAGVGVALGIAASLLLTRVMRSMLFDVRPTDPGTIAAVTVAIIAVAICACLLPARRATRVDPMLVLRQE